MEAAKRVLKPLEEWVVLAYEQENIFSFVLEPGDATRYDIVVTLIGCPLQGTGLFGVRQAVVSYLNLGRCAVLTLDHQMHYSYIQEKMRLDLPHTAMILSVFLEYYFSKKIPDELYNFQLNT